MNLAKLAVDKLINISPISKWRLHGNGFLQIPLPTNNLHFEKRLHVWNPDYFNILSHNSTIHDHVWDMTSKVLLGNLTHITYEVVSTLPEYSLIKTPSDNFSIFECDVWSVGKANEKGLGNKLNTDTTIPRYARQTGEYSLPAGSQYKFAKNQFHETPASNRCVTLMTKELSSVEDGKRPNIIVPFEEKPVDAFDFEQPSSKKLIDDLTYALSEYKDADIKYNLLPDLDRNHQ